MPGLLESATLQLRVAKRLAPRRGGTLGERLGRLDDRLVFVVGSPRSGTTFLAGAIGSLPGFVDWGELAPLKAAVPELVRLPPAEAASRLRRILALARRIGLVGSVRGVEHGPDVAFLLAVVHSAFPEARIVHLVRDGRDVACSLLEKPWLRPVGAGTGVTGTGHGAHSRWWVEPERRGEFEAASDARRAAWAWRSYLSAARSSPAPLLEVRYERLVEDPRRTAVDLGQHLDAPGEPLAAALGRAHRGSVGRYRDDLDDRQLADVLAEAGGLLRELGYL